MKINQNLVIGLAIGILIGSVGVGFLDANRPKPLFSSAWLGDDPDDKCQDFINAVATQAAIMEQAETDRYTSNIIIPNETNENIMNTYKKYKRDLAECQALNPQPEAAPVH